MLVLFETPAGYALFKLHDDGKLDTPDDLQKDFATPEAANKLLKLKAFGKFENTTDAMQAVTGIVEGKMPKNLKKFLSGEISESELKKEKLIVGDAKLGASISKKLGITVVSDSTVNELMRGIRSQLESLLQGIPESDLRSMVLGLSHSLSRYKLKFSPDKVDTMIIQAISLLDDLDKELNTYAMRIKEWYGWHFPEMQKIIVDNQAYAKVIKAVGMRTNIGSTDLSTILPEELEAELKEAAEVSMGTEISEEDIENITFLSDQVISISEYRAQLYDYLKNRMAAIAPNLTVLVGELVGARLIAHAGSLMNLAKYPASTVQILGAEKALFRALKTKHDTPKYGLLYHASLVGQAAPKLKGKMARAVATKAALSIRVDALGDKDSPEIGIELRAKTEARLRQLEGRQTHISNKGAGKGKSPMQKFELAKGTKTYNTAADVEMNGETPAKNEKKSRPTTDAEETPNGESEKKKKKKDKSEGSSKKRKNEEDADEQPKSEKKKDKRAKKAKKSSSDSD